MFDTLDRISEARQSTTAKRLLRSCAVLVVCVLSFGVLYLAIHFA